MADADYTDVDDLVSAAETATSTTGKYFCISVPDYENTVDSVSSDKESYLRIGAATTTWTSEPGADLAALAYLVGTAGNATATDGGYTLTEGENALTALKSLYPDITKDDLCDPFVDDQRERGSGSTRPDGPGGHGLSPTERRAASAKLHSSVGWRDHTDGNRISTTRGDRVDVVYGNYKMIVMGRQSDTGEAMAWDVTGNHIQDFGGGTMPGASVTLEWVPDTTYGQVDGSDKNPAGGAWLLQNSTERVYQYSRFAGNFKEEWWGDLIENYIGSENPEQFGTSPTSGQDGHPTYRDEALGKKDVLCPENDSTDIPRGNPTIIERTWAQKIDSRTGSNDWKIPSIHEETWAEHVHEETHTTRRYATEWAEIIQDYLVADLIIEGHTAALTLRGFGGAVVDFYVGPKLQGELAGSITLTGFWKFEASFGWTWGYHNFKDEMALLENKVTGLETKIGAVKSQIITATTNTIEASKTSITATMNTRIDNVNTALTNTQTEVHAHTTRLGGLHAELTALIFLG